MPFACLASQKNYMSLYLLSSYSGAGEEQWLREQFAKAGKKLDMGKSCVRFKKLEDLPLSVVGEAIRRVSVASYIAAYEAALDAPRPAKKAVLPRRSPRRALRLQRQPRKPSPQKGCQEEELPDQMNDLRSRFRAQNRIFQTVTSRMFREECCHARVSPQSARPALPMGISAQAAVRVRNLDFYPRERPRLCHDLVDVDAPEMGLGNFYESNPVARYFLNHWGVKGLIYFKMAVVAFVCVIAQIVATRREASAASCSSWAQPSSEPSSSTA